MHKKLYLLDAMALIYRAYYALIRSPRLTSQGRNTNAQFGMTNTIVDLLNKEKPSHMAVCFDTHAPTERHTDFTDYKANRQEAPEDLLGALDDIKRIIKGFNIPVIESDGYEADDVIGTLAWQAADAGYDVYMVTPDKDYGQLLTKPGVFIYKPGYQGGDMEILDAQKICAKWDIARVEQVIDMLGLMGDAVDNIPGIKGVGEKTAAKLLKEYDSLENILANAENIKGSLGEKIRAGKEMAIMSKKLATIITNAPVQFHEEDYKLKEWNKDVLKEIFLELEFKTMGQRILGIDFNVFSKKTTDDRPLTAGGQMDLFGNATANAPLSPGGEAEQITVVIEEDRTGLAADKNINNTPHEYLLVEGEDDIAVLLEKLLQQKEICFDTETTSIDANNAELVGLSFSWKVGEAYYLPCPPELDQTMAIITQLKPIFEKEDLVMIGQNIKYDLLILKWYGVEPKATMYDTMLAHYLIEPEGRRSMDLLSAQYLGYQPVSITELIGKKGKDQGTMRDVEIEKVKEYAGEDADVTLQLKHTFMPIVAQKKVGKVLDEIENPLLKVLTDIEFEGVKIDVDFLNEYSKELEREAKVFEDKVYATAGLKFNLASPKQLGEVLFDKLQLDPSAKKTKTGQYQTGEDVLVKLAAKGHEIADNIVGFRELTKLKNTYVDSLPLLINPKTGRVHTNYAQAVAVTGRLSSTNPNLQNIPIRTDRGREIRKAFVPRDADHVLLSADYSQIELRIVAAISGDPNMMDAFKTGKDIHTATAAKVFNVPENEVTKDMRRKAKSVNFGIIYGQGAFGLADNLGISRSEAKEIIDNYKKEFPNIQKYMDDTIRFAQANGYVETLMGRKRWLKDITSSNFTVRGYAERNAINSPIQGTAADMIKLAMIAIHKKLKASDLKGKMILQVHDELVFDVPKNEVEIFKPLILECMQNALALPNGIPTDAEVGAGDNWLEAH
jgi:DNA polymerase-1